MALQLLRGQFLETCPLPTTDLTDRTYIVTGANSGLGLDAAKHLYRLNCDHVILACRDQGKGERARTEILDGNKDKSTHNHVSSNQGSTARRPTISVWDLDMASYASVQAFAQRAAGLPQLHGAILNAGVRLNTYTSVPSTSLETTIAVNVTSTFLLAILLLPTLHRLATTQAQESNHITPHLVIVGSAVHHFAKHDELLSAIANTNSTSTSTSSNTSIFQTLSDPARATPRMGDRYFLSKLLVMLLTVRLAGHMTARRSGVVLNCVSPGLCRTPLFRDSTTTAVDRVRLRVMARSSEEGSRTLVHAVVDAGLASHGEYLSECRVKKMSAWVGGVEGTRAAGLLWDEMVRIAEGVEPGCTGRI